uniref:Uncharacterized protein n=1 Tax=Oryza meridionalis TaxID=40149 RepID=A0A0E0DVI2_9ORYZ
MSSSSCHPHNPTTLPLPEPDSSKSPEPTSVLYNRSPSTSLGSCSSKPPEDPPPPPIAADDYCEDWDAVVDMHMLAPAPAPDSSFLRWIMDAGYANADADHPSFDSDLLQLPMPMPSDHPPQPLVDHLLDAARLLDAGDSTSAREILARLNHRLPSLPSPPDHAHPPLLRAAALLRDALLPPTALPVSSTPLDVPLKLAAHKALADASPTVQFTTFTSTQLFLDALGAARRLHLLDFDVAFGAHWPPLMQELAHHWRRAAAPPPNLKVTALVSPGSRHPLELHLTNESLTRFAAELGIPFEFTVLVFDPLSSASPPLGLSDEAVAVHLTAGSGTFSPAPAHLRVVKELRPAVVVCVDHGCERGALNLLRSCAALVESLDAAGASPDVVSKVEQFVLRPRVERLAVGVGGGPPLQSMLASAGFAALQVSNAAEAQAECLLRRTASHGFHVEKRQAALALWWQRSELVSVSAWRC